LGILLQFGYIISNFGYIISNMVHSDSSEPSRSILKGPLQLCESPLLKLRALVKKIKKKCRNYFHPVIDIPSMVQVQ
jgi:hypothetical protein